MRARWMSWLVLVASCWGAGALAQGGEVAGYVLALEGQWSLRGAGRALVVGAAVPAGEHLVAQPPFERSRVVVVAARSGAVLLSHQCSQADCRQPVALTATDGGRASTGLWGDMVRTVMAQLEREPDRFVATISRSTTRRRTAVLSASAGKVDFGPVLAELPAGKYQGRLSRLICRQPPACPETPLGFETAWAASTETAPTELVADPGLYALEVVNSGGRIARQAWVLLVRPAEHAATTGRFESANQVVQSWGSNVQPAARESFLLATLYSLAGP